MWGIFYPCCGTKRRKYIFETWILKVLKFNIQYDIIDSRQITNKNYLHLNCKWYTLEKYLKLLKRTNIVEFYSQISDIARLYNILDDAGFRDIAKIYGERLWYGIL